jgi:hypothetical protein
MISIEKNKNGGYDITQVKQKGKTPAPRYETITFYPYPKIENKKRKGKNEHNDTHKNRASHF